MGVDPKVWDQQKERATGDDRDSNLVNETIESTKFRIHKIKLGLEDEGKTLTLKSIRDRYLEKDRNQRKILSLFQKHNEECEMKVGVQITNATYGRYKTCYKHDSEFIKMEYKAEDLPVAEINRRFYDRFEYFLKKEKKCAHKNLTLGIKPETQKVFIDTIAAFNTALSTLYSVLKSARLFLNSF